MVKRLTQTLLQEPVVIGMLLLSSVSVWAFCELADDVMEGESHALDERILLSLRTPGDSSDPLGPKWFEELMRDFTALGGMGIVFLFSLLAVTLLWVTQNRRLSILLLIALAGAFLLSMGLKSWFDRPRPSLVPHGSYVYTKSFPSGHSMMAAAMYLTMGVTFAQFVASLRVKAFFLIVAVFLTLSVGISRVYLGVHWPSDVLAGWAAGSAWALACWSIARILHLRSRVPVDSQVD